MGEISHCPVAMIRPGNNDRTVFESRALRELADSIDEHGLAQPITVRPMFECTECGQFRSREKPEVCPGCGNGMFEQVYEIVAGERRFRAVSLLGWDTIPAIVREMNDEEASSIMLIENLQREDLNPIEEARAYKKRLDAGMPLKKLCNLTGRTRSTIQQCIRFLDLAPDIQELIAVGQLGVSYAQCMVRLDANRQRVAVQWLNQADKPTVQRFREVCMALLAEQTQEALFDWSQFMTKPMQIEAPSGEYHPMWLDWGADWVPKPRRGSRVAETIEGFLQALWESSSEEASHALVALVCLYKHLLATRQVLAPRHSGFQGSE